MYVITCSLGYITKYVHLKFRVTLRNNKGKDSINKSKFNGNDYITISGTYPSLVIEIKDEMKESKTEWNSNRSLLLGKFSAYRFTNTSEDLLQKMKEKKELYVYDNGKLVVDQTIAWQMRRIIRIEAGKNLMLLPVVVKDEETNELYEGVSFIINDISNYALFTYEEFSYVVNYIKNLDFDIFGLQLINTALALKEGAKIDPPVVEKVEEAEKSSWGYSPKPEIPKI